MSYRQSSYDPLAYQQQGRPLRPYNWVQWTGVALILTGAVLALGQIGALIGWWRLDALRHAPVFLLVVVGGLLVNSRREPSSLVTPEQREKNKRVLLITLAVCALVIAAAFALEYLGVAP